MLFRTTTTQPTPTPTPTPGAVVDPYIGQPHLLCDGTGTETDRFRHVDMTAGIQTEHDRLEPYGGLIRLVSRQYNITTTEGVVVDGASIFIKGDAGGHNRDPNGLEKSKKGVIVNFKNWGFRFGIENGSGERQGNSGIEEVYMWGSGVNNKDCVGIYIVADQDQFHLNRVHIGNARFAVAIAAHNEGGGGLDTPTISRLNALGCGYGIYGVSAGPSYFINAIDCVLADLEYNSLYFSNPRNQEFNITNLTSVRAGLTSGDAVLLCGRGHQITAPIVRDTGWRYLSNTFAPGTANGIVLRGDDNTITGGQITGTTLGAGVVVEGKGNRIHGVGFRGALGSSANNGGLTRVRQPTGGFSSNLLDIKILAGSEDTAIDDCDPEVKVDDQGIRTTYDGEGTNAGDPNVTGEWYDAANNRCYAANYKRPVVIYDTVNNKLWRYSSRYPDGRRLISSNPN